MDLNTLKESVNKLTEEQWELLKRERECMKKPEQRIILLGPPGCGM
jgi:hypothetical protein